MSQAVGSQAPVTPEVKPLNDKVWQAWLAKGRRREQRVITLQNQVARWGCLAALLFAAILGSRLGPYDVIVRVVVTAGSVAFMSRMFRWRQFAFAAGFALLALVYNPLAPTFDFDSASKRVFLAASAIPFISPQVWRVVKEPRHV